MVLMFFLGVALGVATMAVVGINRSRESSLPVEVPSAASLAGLEVEVDFKPAPLYIRTARWVGETHAD